MPDLLEQLVLARLEFGDRLANGVPVFQHRVGVATRLAILQIGSRCLGDQGAQAHLLGLVAQVGQLLLDDGQRRPQGAQFASDVAQTTLHEATTHARSVRNGELAGRRNRKRRDRLRVDGRNCAPGGIRTHTVRSLKPLPLPLGYRGVPVTLPDRSVSPNDRPRTGTSGVALITVDGRQGSKFSVVLAFTFPGQGSQRPGMGRPWADHESWELVAEASDVAGRDVARLLLDADADELKDTRNAQLTTFVSSLMVLDAVERLGVEPSFCAGHSLGEYTALTATGALGFDDGVRLVCERADAMHEAGRSNPGTMSAILGLDDELVEVACRRADSDVWVANFNAPGQIVIAGSPDGVAKAIEIAKELGAKKAMSLPVSGAFHTPFMTPARDRLRQAIAAANPRDTDVPVISNVDAAAHDHGDEWASLLSAQLSSPVRWRQCLVSLSELGVTSFAELGPGGVLTGMAKRTIDGARTISIATPDDLDKFIEWVNASSPTTAQLEGEHLFAVERLVVSPAAGIFVPRADLAPGAHIEIGTVIGNVGDAEVRSAFAGILQAFIAVDGERITPRQPIAWLRTA